MPLIAGFEDQIADLGEHLVLAEKGTHTTVEHVGELIFARMAVHGSGD